MNLARLVWILPSLIVWKSKLAFKTLDIAWISDQEGSVFQYCALLWVDVIRTYIIRVDLHPWTIWSVLSSTGLPKRFTSQQQVQYR